MTIKLPLFSPSIPRVSKPFCERIIINLQLRYLRQKREIREKIRVIIMIHLPIITLLLRLL